MTSGRLAWLLWAVAVVLLVAEGSLALQNGGREGAGSFGTLFDTIFRLALLVFPTVGALVASRRPGNPIGWIMLSSGLLFAFSGFALSFGTFGLLTRPGSLPAPEVMAWVSTWIFLTPLFATPPLLFLLFPNGRLLSPRWWAAVILVLFGTVTSAAGAAFAPGNLAEPPFEQVANPFGIGGAAGILGIVATVGWITGVAGIVVGAVSMLLRLSRARGVERQQLKWIAAAASLFAIAVVTVGPLLGGGQVAELGQIIILAAFCAIPIAAGIAILRYRLYDIDLIIRRTLVYGAVTAILGAAYVGSVLGLQVLLSSFTANDGPAVAVSTLAVAAMFGPVRRRIQTVVDRHFYRSRYDAQRTLAAFATQLRDEVDLGSLTDALLGTALRTMSPASASVWLRVDR